MKAYVIGRNDFPRAVVLDDEQLADRTKRRMADEEFEQDKNRWPITGREGYDAYCHWWVQQVEVIE